MRRLPGAGAARLCAALCALCVAPRAHPADWLPIEPDELRMSSLPEAPAAAAVYLYRQIDRDDADAYEKVYERLKILTDEGRKYGDVELRFVKGYESIRGLEARTIRPDGSIVNFSGTVYEKPIVSAKGAKVLAKTFSLPDVQRGSIIEYRYRDEHTPEWVFDSHWILSERLYTRHAKFSLEPYPYFSLRWSWPNGLPPNTPLPVKEHGLIRLEARDVPAFVSEEHMPPENEMRLRVDFIYDTDPSPERDPAVYWKGYGKRVFRDVEHFIDKRKAMAEAATQIVQPGDAPEVKLRKLYARVQELRNVTFEPAKTVQESERGPKDARNVEEVWSRSAGSAGELTWLFLALARGAGFAADPVLVSTRDLYFFDVRLMNPQHINSSVVVVKLDGKDLYLDPGIPFTPFGLLPWSETDARALRLDSGGGTWIYTPLPEANASRIERRAKLALDSGTLEGKLTVTYSGLEASWRRLEERNEDDTERRQFLENEVAGVVPTGIDVKLTNSPDWRSTEGALVAEYQLRVPGWASGAGRRQLLPVGLFGNGERHTFEHSQRVHPICFDFPSVHVDDVTIDMPAGWQVERAPDPHVLDMKGMVYRAAAQNDHQSLHLTRELTVNLYLTTVASYPALQRFYQTVRTGDEEQAVITPLPR